MTDHLNNSSPIGSTADAGALIFAIVFPSLVTLTYFQILADFDPAIQQTAYGVGKFLQFAFPVVWVWLFYRQRLAFTGLVARSHQLDKNQLPIDHTEGSTSASREPLSGGTNPNNVQTKVWLAAIVFGILVVLTMCLLFFFVIKPSPIGERLIENVRGKIVSMNIDMVWKYVAIGCFYTVAHSFLEEYYWRWFVFDLGKKFFSANLSNVISSLGFAAHHVILLGFFVGWDSPWAYVISFAIAIGGMVWAWFYHREKSLGPSWVSHAIVDAGIFALGFVIWKSL